MSQAEQLQALAQQLFDLHQSVSDSAGLRRAVSTAYYAVFRLIIDDGIQFLFSSDTENEETRKVFARQFDHNKMLTVFTQLNGSKIKSESKLIGSVLLTPQTQPLPDIATLAKHFIALQEYRHWADYDMSYSFDPSLVQTILDKMNDFFNVWNTQTRDIRNRLCYYLLFYDVKERK